MFFPFIKLTLTPIEQNSRAAVASQCLSADGVSAPNTLLVGVFITALHLQFKTHTPGSLKRSLIKQ